MEAILRGLTSAFHHAADSLKLMYGFAVSSLIGVCLGFLFGVGCALAVMYSIYMGGYRAALRDASRAIKPKRWFEEQSKVEKDPER